ncbi:MAG: sigma-70 family RNA polymerase sigma factor [Acidobacteriota bacterium]
MQDPPAPGPRDFLTTHWSLVLAARPEGGGSTLAREALSELFRRYWYPLYAFVRFRGYGPEEAQDLTQAFLARLLETEGLTSADPERGRFRSYLLGAMKHFLANHWHRERAKKRGGGVGVIDLDALDPEARYGVAQAPPPNPDAGFEREWALAILGRALEELRQDYGARGRGDLFAALQGCLTGDEPNRGDVAARLGLSEGAVKVAVHRLRKRFRASIRAEIAETVEGPGAVDEEMRYLVGVLRGEGA